MSAVALSGAGNLTKATVNSGVGATVTIAKPANTANGDYLVCVIYARGETAGVPVPAPAGWTLIPVAMPSTGIGQVNTFYKRITNAAAEPASYAFTPAGGNRKAAILFRVTGGHNERFFLSASLSDITYGGTMNTAVVPPEVPMRNSLGITIIGTNYSAPLLPPNSVVDELGSTLVDYVSTTTGAGETAVYVQQLQLPTRDALAVNHATMSPAPSSGVAYMLVFGASGVSPEVTLGADRSEDSGRTVRVSASVAAGVVDYFDWRIVGDTPPDFAVDSAGTFVTFKGAPSPAARDFVFEVRGRNTSDPSIIWSEWSRLRITVRAHQSWVLNAQDVLQPLGGAGPFWTRVDNTMQRPGETYVPGGIPVSEFLAKPVFYSAHRGGGDEFPEHTMEAYQGAVSGGLDAIEVSVRVTADGEMICFHDDTLDRTTNATGPIGERTWQDLYDNVRVERSALLGQGMPAARIPKFTDVLAQFAGKKIIYLEGKDGAAHARIFAELDKYAARGINLGEWFIQKQFFKGGSWTKSAAIERGMKVWGYMAAETTDAELDAEDYRTDIWGVPDFMPLARKAQIVARGKPVVCWEVHRRAQVEEHLTIGLKGQMSSSAIYVHSHVQRARTDNFVSRRKSPGDMWTANIAVDNLALAYDGLGGAYHKSPNPICVTVMGSMCPIIEGGTVKATLSWAQTPTSGWSGIAFGTRNDEIFRPDPNFENKVGGYLLAISGSHSTATLYRYDPGFFAPVELATTQLDPRTPGTPIEAQCRVASDGVTAIVNGKPFTSADKTYNGRYFHIAQGTNNTLTTFSKISV